MIYKTTPYNHQMDDLKKTINQPFYAHFWDMRTGKTKLIIDLACNLYKAGKIQAVLVVAPNGVHNNWIDPELPTHCPLPYSAIAWDGSKRSKAYRHQLIKICNSNSLVFFTMNYEAIPTERGYDIAEYFLLRKRCLFVLDESHRIKNSGAQRTKRLLKLSEIKVATMYKRILTGTPITGQPLDLYNQFAFLDTHILKFNSFYTFKHHYAEIEVQRTYKKTAKNPKGWSFEHIKSFKNLDELKKRIAPFVTRIKKEDCLDLPDKIYQRIPVQLSKAQRDAYHEIKENLCLEFNMSSEELTDDILNIFNSMVTCKIPLVKILKLRQIISNFVTTDDGSIVTINKKSNPKLEALIEDLKDSFQPSIKVIVWACFQYEVELITSSLQKIYGSKAVAAYYGKTNKVDRPVIRCRFQDLDPTQPGKVPRKSRLRILVSNPASGGVGLDFSKASINYYFANSYDAEHRWQSEDRSHGPGQTQNVLYKDIVAMDTVDVEVHKVLTKKKKIATQVID